MTRCPCRAIEAEILADHESISAACDTWKRKSAELNDNEPEYDDSDDRAWACTCPACGRIVCNECV